MERLRAEQISASMRKQQGNRSMYGLEEELKLASRKRALHAEEEEKQKVKEMPYNARSLVDAANNNDVNVSLADLGGAYSGGGYYGERQEHYNYRTTGQKDEEEEEADYEEDEDEDEDAEAFTTSATSSSFTSYREDTAATDQLHLLSAASTHAITSEDSADNDDATSDTSLGQHANSYDPRPKLMFKGVTRNGNSFRSQITSLKGEQLYLGTFPSQEEAAFIYDKRARELFGVAEIKRFNFEDDKYDELCEKFQNGDNLKRKVRYKGVYVYGNSFRAQISVEGKTVYLGTFTTEEEAAFTYDKKAKELYDKVDNKLNFTEEEYNKLFKRYGKNPHVPKKTKKHTQPGEEKLKRNNFAAMNYTPFAHPMFAHQMNPNAFGMNYLTSHFADQQQDIQKPKKKRALTSFSAMMTQDGESMGPTSSDNLASRMPGMTAQQLYGQQYYGGVGGAAADQQMIINNMLMQQQQQYLVAQAQNQGGYYSHQSQLQQQLMMQQHMIAQQQLAYSQMTGAGALYGQQQNNPLLQNSSSGRGYPTVGGMVGSNSSDASLYGYGSVPLPASLGYLAPSRNLPSSVGSGAAGARDGSPGSSAVDMSSLGVGNLGLLSGIHSFNALNASKAKDKKEKMSKR